MDSKFWTDKWKAGDIGFHQADFEPALTKNFPSLSPGIVFVPLCGKSRDLLWFAKNGWKVRGAELSPIACQAFFEENHLEYQKKTEGQFTVFQGQQVTLWCGDFFNLPKESFSGVTALYDRAALIALPRELREKYAAKIDSLLSTNEIRRVRILVVALEYPQERADGPPFSVDEDEVRRLYEPLGFRVRLIERQEEDTLPRRSPKFQDVSVFESAFWVEK